MQPYISVIIPVYNHAHTLERTLVSLAKQTYRPLEVIIVNDGSTDNFMSEMKRIQTKESIKSLHSKVLSQTNQGAAAARNRGFKESTGQLVIFWDADTIADPQMLEKMAAALLAHDQAAYVYCRFKFGWKTIKSREFSMAALRQVNYIDTTSLIRRQAFLGFDEKLRRFQDWDLWLSMAEQGKEGIFLPETLFKKVADVRPGQSKWLSRSKWLPSFFYRLPIKNKAVQDYEQAKQVIVKKHQLS